jgi:GDP-4-dehydro-6-deoxy-D-mannose reductase
VRALVTGATGFLGRRLAARLAADGCEVVGAAIERHGLPAGVAFRALDVRDAAAVGALVCELDPDRIFHLAALSHVGDSWKRIADSYEVNVLGTEHVAAAARGRRWVFVSSAEVYGAVEEGGQPIGEGRAPRPRSPYALTKAVGERAALAAGAVVARCFNLVGAGQLASFALPSFASQLAAIGAGGAPPVLRVGNLAARRDFVHVDDAAEALAILAERGEPGSVYNVASGEARTIGQALDGLIAMAGMEVRLETDPARVRPIDVALLCGDPSRLESLGWRARRGFDAAVAELWSEARASREREAAV